MIFFLILLGVETLKPGVSLNLFLKSIEAVKIRNPD